MNMQEAVAVRALLRLARSTVGEALMLSSEVAEAEPVIGAFYRNLDLNLLSLEITFAMSAPVVPKRRFPFRRVARADEHPEVDMELLSRAALRAMLRNLGERAPIEHLSVNALRERIKAYSSRLGVKRPCRLLLTWPIIREITEQSPQPTAIRKTEGETSYVRQKPIRYPVRQ